jgi:hypothetical protein
MGLEQATFLITGIRPLLMHNGRLNDPLDPATVYLKEVTSVKGKSKTEEIQLETRRREWLGGLYTDAKGRPCVTEDMLLGSLIEGARKTKDGKKAECVLCSESTFALEYDGPKDIDKLYATPGFADVRRAGVMGSGIMRTRPRFNAWKVKATFMYDPDIIDVRTMAASLATAGRQCGMGDYRPRFGLFEAAAV